MKIVLKDIFSGAVLGGVMLSGAMSVAAGAQTHKVAKPENVVRAVGVYEWTGDLTKSTGSRLVPVSLFIDGKLEDAGEYLARPIPMAVLNGNVYELQQAGVGKGLLDLAYARHLTTLDTAYDEGWFGYGAYKPEAPAKKAAALRQSKTLASVTTGSSSDKPHFSTKDGAAKDGSSNAGAAGKSDSSASTGNPDRPTMKRRTDDTGSDTASTKSDSSTPAGDPDRPTMKRRTDDSASGTSSGSTTASAAGDSSAPSDDPDRPTMKRRTDDTGSNTASTKSDSSAPASDPDRPTMQRRTDDSGSGTSSAGDSTTTASTGSAPADDPDRPTLKRRSPEEAKKAAREANSSSVTGVGSLNDDPSRPTMHRGKPVSSMTAEDLPPLKGLPTDLHQMVAVSDAADRPQHDFARPWEDDQERAAMLAKMQTIARAQLAGYGVTAAAASTPLVVKKTTTTTSKARSTKKPVTPPVEPLLDEDLKGYMLSYGGLPTYVYQAHTAGEGATLRYVTVVAQADGVGGELHVALKNVTDAAHLDRTPRLRLVDAVDAEASNRASLLFELREQSSRQFALYRVIGARSEQIFLTGTTQ